MMFYVCLMVIGVAGIGALVFLAYMAFKYKMCEMSLDTTEKIMEPVSRLCDVMVKYFEYEIEELKE